MRSFGGPFVESRLQRPLGLNDLYDGSHGNMILRGRRLIGSRPARSAALRGVNLSRQSFLLVGDPRHSPLDRPLQCITSRVESVNVNGVRLPVGWSIEADDLGTGLALIDSGSDSYGFGPRTISGSDSVWSAAYHWSKEDLEPHKMNVQAGDPMTHATSTVTRVDWMGLAQQAKMMLGYKFGIGRQNFVCNVLQEFLDRDYAIRWLHRYLVERSALEPAIAEATKHSDMIPVLCTRKALTTQRPMWLCITKDFNQGLMFDMDPSGMPGRLRSLLVQEMFVNFINNKMFRMFEQTHDDAITWEDLEHVPLENIGAAVRRFVAAEQGDTIGIHRLISNHVPSSVNTWGHDNSVWWRASQGGQERITSVDDSKVAPLFEGQGAIVSFSSLHITFIAPEHRNPLYGHRFFQVPRHRIVTVYSKAPPDMHKRNEIIIESRARRNFLNAPYASHSTYSRSSDPTFCRSKLLRDRRRQRTLATIVSAVVRIRTGVQMYIASTLS
ncbi:hypothetical protein BDK51DRAFT_41466 [Blyttiomyces helicus]|uniref:Uncharacterized protein n=1 Tax=Blyttiomyces helicus TaxID=388810 RepID=A0A4P9WPH6_9FUNG|nr:hypothetical protein BDK51DRAFT_41466 [Blyttiomyces helicus]|eukprot:RKO94412.1 hypothetical protein BDK51DRAFT_41466 [Blyttiomyces helicus]